MELISSASNPKIRTLLLLQSKASERRERGVFVVEGRREIERCRAAGYVLDTLFVCPEIAGEPGIEASRTIRVSPEVYSKVAYRAGTEGMIAEFRTREHPLSALDLPGNALVAVMESVEKPGNVGAVLRCCDAAGADALIICDERCDIYNPNVIRASTGAVFSVPTAICSSADAISFLKGKGISILTAQLQDSSLYYDTPMTGATAIVLGTEDKGLSALWREAADAHIRIPMLGAADSLNVSVSAAILLYEAVRQRQTWKNSDL